MAEKRLHRLSIGLLAAIAVLAVWVTYSLVSAGGDWPLALFWAAVIAAVHSLSAVSYTHLTLPTIYSV